MSLLGRVDIPHPGQGGGASSSDWATRIDAVVRDIQALNKG